MLTNVNTFPFLFTLIEIVGYTLMWLRIWIGGEFFFYFFTFFYFSFPLGSYSWLHILLFLDWWEFGKWSFGYLIFREINVCFFGCFFFFGAVAMNIFNNVGVQMCLLNSVNPLVFLFNNYPYLLFRCWNRSSFNWFVFFFFRT